MKKISIILTLGLGLFLGLALMITQGKAVSFESWESLGQDNAPVFNEIQFRPGIHVDLWIMRQSHHGLTADKTKWDRLAIRVKKSQSPMTAEFFQLSPGDSEFNGLAESIPLKVACLSCHANGPRAIRPKVDSTWIKNSPLEIVSITLMNLRIKTYGIMKNQEAVHFDEGAPLSNSQGTAEAIQWRSCQYCHSEQGIRSKLSLEQAGSIRFMLKNKLMPPFPFRIFAEDQDQMEVLVNN